jgi:hypothetical protein
MYAAVWLCWVLAMLLSAGVAAGQSNTEVNTRSTAQEPGGEAPPDKTMTAQRVPSGAVHLDGRLEDEIWESAEFHTDFRQKGKDRNFAPRTETAVAFLYDDDALYVGVRMAADPLSRRRGVMAGRDDPGQAERVLVSIDTYRDFRTAFTFGVTDAGVRLDYVDGRDNESSRNDSFNPVWNAQIAFDDEGGWSAEMRIPFSQLRFTSASPEVWGINVRRWNPASFLNLYWVAVPYEQTGWVSRFGELRGLEDVGGGRPLEVTPYALERRTYIDARSPVDRDDERSVEVGGDLRVGLGPSLTLDATVKPDFGQVEADPARVNLTAFETFFPERRTFFAEDQAFFRTRGPNYFYSRRVGSIPTLAGGGGVFEDVAEASVLGGAKLTGRTPGGLSSGVLGALTGRETVPASETGSLAEVAPRTAFLVGRLRQEIGDGGSSVGLMATGVERSFADDGGLASLVADRALAGGVDWVVRMDGGRHELTGFLGASRVQGTAEAITRLQRSSAHYFQRPDASHVDLDPTRTALTGWAAGFSLGRIGGGEWRWNIDASANSPGFEVRDAGSLNRADHVEAGVGISRRVRNSSGTMRNRGYGLALVGAWNFAGTRRQMSPSGHFTASWANRWTTYLELGMNLASLSDDLTRGGPLMETPRTWWLDATLGGPRTGSVWWSLQGNGSVDEFEGWSTGLTGSVTAQAGRRFEVSLVAGGAWGDDSRLFLTTVGGGSEATYGNRFVFGRAERREYLLQGRTRFAFAPDAVLTLYAEPFISTGGVHDLGELSAARARTLRRYGTDGTAITRLDDGSWEVMDGTDVFRVPNSDFWIRSFRTTAVFRWEWWRGSSLFLIWQGNGSRFNNRMGPTGPDTFLRSLRDPGEDILAAKVTMLLRGR